MLLQLIKNYGEETAIKLIEFYLNHPQSFYVIRGHPLELCVKDGDWLLTQMKAGQALKDADIRTYREKQLKPKWDSRGVWDLEELERLYQQRCGKN